MILSPTEKNEIVKRIRMSLLKYLVRDPIFNQFLKPTIEKYTAMVRIPSYLVTYLLAYINYFRFYSYIA